MSASSEYDAFGKLVAQNAATPEDESVFRYTGKWTDDATALQYNVNRWYDASNGKWISEDPIGFDGGDTNLYRYVGNNPVRYADSLGTVRHVFAFEGFLGYKRKTWIFGLFQFSDSVIYDNYKAIVEDPTNNAEWHYYSQQGALSAINDITRIGAKRKNNCKFDTVILLGHSYGGNAVFKVAKELQSALVKDPNGSGYGRIISFGIDLAFTIDPVSKWRVNTKPDSIGAYGFYKTKNVTRWHNYYQRLDYHSGPGWTIYGDKVKNAVNKVYERKDLENFSKDWLTKDAKGGYKWKSTNEYADRDINPSGVDIGDMRIIYGDRMLAAHMFVAQKQEIKTAFKKQLLSVPEERSRIRIPPKGTSNFSNLFVF